MSVSNSLIIGCFAKANTNLPRSIISLDIQQWRFIFTSMLNTTKGVCTMDKSKPDTNSSSENNKNIIENDHEDAQLCIENRSPANFQEKAPSLNDNKETEPHDCKTKNSIETKEQWNLLPVLFISFIFTGYNFSMFPVLYVELANQFGVSLGSAGWIPSGKLTTSTVAVFLTSSCVVKWGCRRVITIGSITMFLSVAIASQCTELWHMILTFGIARGIAESMVFPVLFVMIQQVFNKNRSLATYICLAGNGLGLTIGPMCMRFLMQIYGWRGALLISSALLLQLLPLAQFLKSPRHYIKPGSSLWKQTFDFSLLRQPSFAMYFVHTFLLALVITNYLNHIVSRALARGESLTRAAALAAMFGAVLIPTRLLLGWVVNLKQMNKILTLATCVLIRDACIGYGMWLLGQTYTGTVVVHVVMSMMQGLIIPLQSVVSVEITSVEKYPRATALCSMARFFPLLFGAPLVGWIYDTTQNYDLPFIFIGNVGIISALFCFLVFLLHRREKRQQKKKQSSDQEMM